MRRSLIQLYSLIMMLNCGVAVMFWAVSTPPPAFAASEGMIVQPIQRLKYTLQGVPNRLVIESIGVDLPVQIGTYDQSSGEWTVGDDSAYFADNSVPPNNSNGTTLIYGHAKAPIFASLSGLQAGAKADVYTSNGRVFHYIYQSVDNVDPNDTSIFRVSGPPELTLQTCTGPWDMYRALYHFQLNGANKV